MHPNDNEQTQAAQKPTLSELLRKSFEDDAVFDEDTVDDHERWDDDEGAFGG